MTEALLTVVRRVAGALRDLCGEAVQFTEPAGGFFLWLRLAEPYIWSRLARAGVELRTYPDFFHARFLLADDDKLLVGSSNFSRHSFRCNQEICLLITDAEFIAGFKARMLADTGPLEVAKPAHQRGAGAAWGRVVAHFYFHVVIGAAKLVAPLSPALARRLSSR